MQNKKVNKGLMIGKRHMEERKNNIFIIDSFRISINDKFLKTDPSKKSIELDHSKCIEKSGHAGDANFQCHES